MLSFLQPTPHYIFSVVYCISAVKCTHTHTSLHNLPDLLIPWIIEIFMNFWNIYQCLPTNFIHESSIFLPLPLWHRLTRTTSDANALHYMSDKAQPHNTKYIFPFSIIFARTTDFSLSHHEKINIIQRFRSIFHFFFTIFFIFHFSFAYCWWNNMKYVKHKINFMIPNLLFLKSHERFLYLSHFSYQLFQIIFNL